MGIVYRETIDRNRKIIGSRPDFPLTMNSRRFLHEYLNLYERIVQRTNRRFIHSTPINSKEGFKYYTDRVLFYPLVIPYYAYRITCNQPPVRMRVEHLYAKYNII